MGFEVILSLSLGFLATLLKTLFESNKFEPFWEWLDKHSEIKKILNELGVKHPQQDSYQARVNRLVQNFQEITSETSLIVSELETLVNDRRKIVDELEKEQEDLAGKIEKLRSSPQFGTIEIQNLLLKMDKDQAKESRRSAFRDYGLYILGVLTPILLNWLSNLFG